MELFLNFEEKNLVAPGIVFERKTCRIFSPYVTMLATFLFHRQRRAFQLVFLICYFKPFHIIDKY